LVPRTTQQFSYFQFRFLPVASQSSVVATRWARVSGREGGGLPDIGVDAGIGFHAQEERVSD